LPQFNVLSTKLLDFLSSKDLRQALVDHEKELDQNKEEEERKLLEQHKRALGLVNSQPVRPTKPRPPNNNSNNNTHNTHNNTVTRVNTTSLSQSLSSALASNIFSVLPFNSKKT